MQVRLKFTDEDLKLARQGLKKLPKDLVAVPVVQTGYMSKFEVASLMLTPAENYMPGWLLLEASYMGANDMVESLLKLGVSPFECDADGNTPLQMAAVARHPDVCKSLLAHGADPEAPNMNHMSAWDAAICLRDSKLRRVLRPTESDKDVVIHKGERTPLFRAINNEPDTAKAIMGVEAALEGNWASFLVGREKIDDTGDAGVTGLMIASRLKKTELVKHLLTKGAKVELESKHGCTALSMAAEEGAIDIVQILVEAGAQIDQPGVQGNTPLLRAAENGHVACITYLMEKGADVNHANSHGWTPLMLACYNGHPAALKKLLTAKQAPGAFPADRTAGKPKTGYTALYYACYTGHVGCAKALVDGLSEAEIDMQNGKDALSVAMLYGFQEAIDIFSEMSWFFKVKAKEGHDRVHRGQIRVHELMEGSAEPAPSNRPSNRTPPSSKAPGKASPSPSKKPAGGRGNGPPSKRPGGPPPSKRR